MYSIQSEVSLELVHSKRVEAEKERIIMRRKRVKEQAEKEK